MTAPIRATKPAVFYFRVAMGIAALLLPLLSLIAFGSLWLWQNGYVLYWALGACVLTGAVFAIERYVFRVDTADSATPIDLDAEPDAGWSARETEAWTAVVALSKQVKPLEIDSREDAFQLGVTTIEAVARAMHPGEDHALWKFTLPEALALVERVSSELSLFVTNNIPLGDRMTVGQFLRVYRWRNVVGLAEQAYDLWRIVRLINPAAAATQEIREQLTRRAYDWGREELAKRLAQAYVREVGRAAIDLYSGRMRLTNAALRQASLPVTAATSNGAETATSLPLMPTVRVLVTGLAGERSDDAFRAMAGKVQPGPAAAKIEPGTVLSAMIEGIGEVVVVRGHDADAGSEKTLLRAAEKSDMVVWVSSGTPRDRILERRTIVALRDGANARTDRRAPPIVVAVVAEAGAPIDTAALASDLDVEARQIVVVASNGAELSPGAVTAVIAAHADTARHAAKSRLIAEARSGWRLGRVWSQIRNAGKSLGGGAD